MMSVDFLHGVDLIHGMGGGTDLMVYGLWADSGQGGVILVGFGICCAEDGLFSVLWTGIFCAQQCLMRWKGLGMVVMWYRDSAIWYGDLG